MKLYKIILLNIILTSFTKLSNRNKVLQINHIFSVLLCKKEKINPIIGKHCFYID